MLDPGDMDKQNASTLDVEQEVAIVPVAYEQATNTKEIVSVPVQANVS